MRTAQALLEVAGAGEPPVASAGRRGLASEEASPLTVRVELDFRHGLTEPRVEQGPEGPRLSLTRGQEQLVVLLPRHALEAIWFALTQAVRETR